MKVVKASLLASLSLLANGLEECVDVASFAKNYIDESTQEHKVTGQCVPSTMKGAYYTKYVDFNATTMSKDADWMCISAGAPQPLDDGAAKQGGFEGACTFAASVSTVTPEEVPLCSTFLNHNPVDCGPGPPTKWGACVSAISERWLCLDASNPSLPGFAKGDCVAQQVREDTNGHLYDNVCRFALPDKVETWKCDTVTTYTSSDAATCGGTADPSTQYEACFSLTKGLQWQCMDADFEQVNPCDWTLTSDPKVFYDGKCLFPNAPGYDNADSDPTLKPTTSTTTTTTTTTTTILGNPDPDGGDDGGMGAGWIVVLILLVLTAAGGFFFYWRRAPARAQPLIGNIEARGY